MMWGRAAMNCTNQLEILCEYLAAGAQAIQTTLPALDFSVKTFLVNTRQF